MKPYYEQAGVVIYHGDAREVLPQLAPVNVAITDPVWPNATADLAGSDRPAELFAEAACHFPRLCQRAVVQLGCDSDPRFLLGMPAALPFLRLCWLEYALCRPKGRILYSGDVAYVFGTPADQHPGRRLAPGRMVSARPDHKRPRRRHWDRKASLERWTLHPCPRRLEHVGWLVRWFADGCVLDPFMGIGTTLVAAKYQGLSAIGIEVEEKFCAVAVERLAQGSLLTPEAP